MGLFSILNWVLPISGSGFQDASQSSSPGPKNYEIYEMILSLTHGDSVRLKVIFEGLQNFHVLLPKY